MNYSSRPQPGWEPTDPPALVSSSQFISIDEPDFPDLPDTRIPKNPELLETARAVYETLGKISELPTGCSECPTTFDGIHRQFRVTIFIDRGDGEDPEITTLCEQCYSNFVPRILTTEEEHQQRVVRYMYANGATQPEIAEALKLSQSTVCRILKKKPRN